MNKFDQHIKDKLSQPQLPPLDAWKNIQEKLDEKEKKKRIIPLFYWIGSTAACLVVGISIYYFNQNDTVNVNHTPTNEVVKTKSTSKESTKKDWNNIEHTNEKSSDKKIVSSVKKSTESNQKIIQHSSSYFENIIGESSLFSNTIPNQKEDKTQELSQTNSTQKDNFVQNNSTINPKNEASEKETNPKILEEKPLELVLQEEKKKEKEKVEIKQKSPLLTVSSYINPTKMLDSKSILADEFNDHTIKNNLTVAYGAKVSVRINDKINVRSGIAKVELEQNTTNVNSGINMGVYALSASNPKTANNITYHSNIRIIPDQSNQNTVTTILSSDTNNMEQKVHYIEIPLEVEYKLASFDKFNLLATAGGSYYVVTKNTISLADVNTRSQYKLGEASNLNDMSYSANAGVKLEYNLSNKSSINLEPNYRYMLNPLKNVDAKNPSLLGLNLGFSIKF
ncbi:outer membrane beta-barrel protein [Empedobacter falsenii]|uniref:Outer membrane beta-barrel protein n=1 Tax=Empedobacter falsenii TaxID=343874 RepID=A0AAW7DL55_9FLAO|nr:outer membrane beta-barrel protein [Empedobacter falsenii]MDM1552505.1 outer membrane beta-barrel protein [Empedobacter falsenii]